MTFPALPFRAATARGPVKRKRFENIRDAIQEYLAALRQLKRNQKLLKNEVAV